MLPRHDAGFVVLYHHDRRTRDSIHRDRPRWIGLRQPVPQCQIEAVFGCLHVLLDATSFSASVVGGMGGAETFAIKSNNKKNQVTFLSKLLQGIAFVPAIVNGVEGLFGHKSGADKQNMAMALVQNTLSVTDAIAGKDIADPGKFQDGLGEGDRRGRAVPELVGVGEGQVIRDAPAVTG